jgi:hypothetical protein
MEKATRRVDVLNKCSSNSFDILSTVDSKYLHSLAVDSNISMGDQEEVLIQHLDSFKAQVLAQIALDRLDQQMKKEKEVEMNSRKGKSHTSGAVEDQKGRKMKGKKVVVGKRKKRASGREDGDVELVGGEGPNKKGDK